MEEDTSYAGGSAGGLAGGLNPGPPVFDVPPPPPPPPPPPGFLADDWPHFPHCKSNDDLMTCDKIAVRMRIVFIYVFFLKKSLKSQNI